MFQNFSWNRDYFMGGPKENHFDDWKMPNKQNGLKLDPLRIKPLKIWETVLLLFQGI